MRLFALLAVLSLASTAARAADVVDDKIALYRQAAATQQALESGADNPALLRQLAITYGRLALYDKALSACVQLVALEPHEAANRYDLGWSYHRLKRYEEAAASYREALGLDPGLESASYNLALALIEKADYAGAYEVGIAGIARHPDSPKLHLATADALKRAGKLPAAREFARKAATLYPDYFDAAYALTAIAVQAGDTAEALLEFGKALAIDPRAREYAAEDDDLKDFVRSDAVKGLK